MTPRPTPFSGHRFDPTILRENDVRGVVGDTFFEADAYAIGRSFGTVVAIESGGPVCVGRDGRLTSPALEEALVSGLVDCGVDVIRVGLGPTPALYFAVHEINAAGGVMITGSHNPPGHNGVKLMIGTRPFHGERISALGEMAATASWASGSGSQRSIDIMDLYIDRLLSDFPPPRRNLTIAWDAGNGAAGEAMRRLSARLPGYHILLNETIDGTFPAHHPDPTIASNLAQLRETVLQQNCEAGFAFDGDGDRIGAVDGDGNILLGDQILMILAEDILAKHPGATVIADIKSSQGLFDRVTELGGIPLMHSSGHSLIKERMMTTGALLAGELSGHIFIADRYPGYDDALYAAVRLLALLSSGSRSLSDIRSGLPRFFNTPEVRIPCSEDRKQEVIEETKRRLIATATDFCAMDGVRVTTDDGWWLLRPSNTQAVLVTRCESATRQGLARLIGCLEHHLTLSGIDTGDLQKQTGEPCLDPAVSE